MVAQESHKLQAVGSIPTPAPKCLSGGMVDTADLESAALKSVEVRIFSWALGKESKRSMGTERRYRTCLTVWPDSMLVLVRDWRGHMICSNRLPFVIKPLSFRNQKHEKLEIASQYVGFAQNYTVS